MFQFGLKWTSTLAYFARTTMTKKKKDLAETLETDIKDLDIKDRGPLLVDQLMLTEEEEDQLRPEESPTRSQPYKTFYSRYKVTKVQPIRK
jgi:hypothetical protein